MKITRQSGQGCCRWGGSGISPGVLIGLLALYTLGCGGNIKTNEDVDEDSDVTTDTSDDLTDTFDDPTSDPLPDGSDPPLDIPDATDTHSESTDVIGDEVYIDEDDDGHPVWDDCDDSDPDVIPGSIRTCTSACDYGTETCLSGSWTPCSASTDCTCDAPGESRTIDCGRCGTASQSCGTDNLWTAPSDCFSEGDCFVGEVDEQGCGFCGRENRICDSSCDWLEWSECANPGFCDPGSTRYTRGTCDPGYFQQELCEPLLCDWVLTGSCTNDCPGPVRTGGYEEEICIPGGPFVMGCDAGEDCEDREMPEHIVTLAPYAIAKFEVTCERFSACIAAGGCDSAVGGLYYCDDVGRELYPVEHISRDQAIQFCQWDGGRVLATEAQWEKAARGGCELFGDPTSCDDPDDERIFPWGSTFGWDCDEWIYFSCPDWGPYEVGAYPLDSSPYGVVGMLGNQAEYVADLYSDTYYTDGPLVDPIGPSTGEYYVVRGNDYMDLWSDIRLTYRNGIMTTAGFSSMKTIRCVNVFSTY